MRFTRHITFCLILASVFSCTRQEKAEEPSTTVRLVVDILSPSTKVLGSSAADDATISDLQVLVFKGNALDGYGHSSSSVATVSCTSGERAIYAVANADDLSAIKTLTQLKLCVSRLGTSVDGLQMIGSETTDVQDGASIHIDVSRFAARVVLKSIKYNSLDSEASPLVVKSVYLINVVGDCLFDSVIGGDAEYTVQNWYNKRQYDAEDPVALFYDAVSDGTIRNGEVLQQEHRFYAYPNSFPYTIGAPWSERATELVIRGEISGNTNYYVIKLPNLEANHSYVIEMVNITRPGNTDDEETVIEGLTQSFDVSSKTWVESTIYDEGVVNF